MNTKLKLLNCNANIYFNRKCLELNLTTIYAQIKLKMNPHNKIVNKKMIDKFQRTRIKNEIKFWYTKKQHLNKVLYNLPLLNGHIWKNLWNIIYQNIKTKIEQKMKTKYDTINNKIKKLKEGKESNNTSNNTTNHTFFK
jgi:hypothetical protein